MRWVLVWWIIHPGHSQVLHIQKVESEEACRQYISQLQAPEGKQLRARCSRE